MENEKINLSYDWYSEENDIGGSTKEFRSHGTIEAVIGECKKKIDGFNRLSIKSISKECITFSFFDEEKELRPGSSISFSYEVDGYEDHDGVVWSTEYYRIKICWDDVKA